MWCQPFLTPHMHRWYDGRRFPMYVRICMLTSSILFNLNSTFGNVVFLKGTLNLISLLIVDTTSSRLCLSAAKFAAGITPYKYCWGDLTRTLWDRKRKPHQRGENYIQYIRTYIKCTI